MNASAKDFGLRAYRTIGYSLIFIIFGAVCFMFVKALFSGNDRELQQSLIAAGIGVTISCLMVWLLDVLRILTLRQGWNKLLWTVLVASILGNAALAFKRWDSKAGRLTVSCLLPLEADANGNLIKPFSLREDSRFARGEAIVFMAALRGAQINADGDYSVEVHASLEDEGHGYARFARSKWSASKRKFQSSNARAELRSLFEKLAPECISDDTVVFAPFLKGATGSEMSFGLHRYRVTFFDLTAGTYATSDAQISLVAGKGE